MAGAAAATAGVVLPSFVIIILIVMFLHNLNDNVYVQGALMGIKAAICGLICVTLYNMCRHTLKNVFSCIIAAAVFAIVVFLRITVIIVIVAAALAGYVFVTVKAKRGDGK